MIAKLVDANPGDEDMPQAFIDSLFDAILTAAHHLIPYYRDEKLLRTASTNILEV